MDGADFREDIVKEYLERQYPGEKKNDQRKQDARKEEEEEDGVMRSTTGTQEGSAGYGDRPLLEEAFQMRNAPERLRGKFEFFFRTFPVELREALQMDEVATFSVTEGSLAETTSKRLLALPGITDASCIVDATACVGGNSMSFIMHFGIVHSIELNKKRCKMLRHNLDSCFKGINERRDS